MTNEDKKDTDILAGENNGQEDVKEEGGKKGKGNGEQKSKERVFTASEVQAMLEQVARGSNLSEKENKEDDRKKVRLARVENKLVVDFKNRNNDEFLPGIVIHAFNRWDNEAKQNIAWVEVVFDDGSTKEMPLLFLVSSAKPITASIIKENIIDESYSIGTVEQRIYDESGGSMKGNGLTVKQEVKKYSKTFLVELPNGEQITVPDYIINMV